MEHINSLRRKEVASLTEGETSSKANKRESKSSLGWENDVFLNFRGTDTRNDFTDYLYVDLKQAQIRTFRDKEGLHVGDKIGPSLMRAIECSQIFIAIFSMEYASSEWCLKELAYVVEHQQREKQQVILPVFLDVSPHDVKHQTGSYEKAFHQHKEEGAKDEDINKWKKALEEVGEIKGPVLETDANRSKGELKNLVIERVLELLHKPYVTVTDNLVGTDDRVNELHKMLCMEMNGVKFVGIWGMGGVGKTTLAQVMYNKISIEFDYCSFLSDVQDHFKSVHGATALQKQLIFDVLKGKSRDFSTKDQGIAEIREACRSKKVLIVLDDISESGQIDKLAGGVEFGPRSRVLVTTRDKRVLNSLQPRETYEVKELDKELSLQLFCKHAFKSDHLLENTDIAEQIVSSTGGLPLALEVIGSYLHNRENSDWVDTLAKLKERPDDKVRKAFEISYYALNHWQQHIFLDVACFFIGFEKDLVSYMWRSFTLSSEDEIKVLVNMSLIKIDQENTLQMHDQLKDFGRTIANEEHLTIPGKRSRIWSPEEAEDVLNERVETNRVQALCLEWIRDPILPIDEYIRLNEPDKYKVPCLIAEGFANLPYLRFLKLGWKDLSGDFQGLLQNLRWLSWSVRNPEIVPANLSLKNLVILDLSCSLITENWGGWSFMKHARNLKVLDLRSCYDLRRTPNFPENAILEKLYLTNCMGLLKIDPSIGYLKSLVLLDLSFCHKLKELPGEMGSLTSLVELVLDKSGIYTIPTYIRALPKLQKLQPSWEYDIFLSFRGADTGFDFIYYIYEGLNEVQVHTFIDSESLQVGEEIGRSLTRPIENSSILVPIFSSNYASSKWCLRELAHMVEHKRESQVILPVFYDMNPRDVKYQTGSYEKAFGQHIRKGISDEVIHKWKEALKMVGNLQGLVLETDANRSKDELKNIVVKTVSNLLRKPHVNVADNLVGIDR